MYSKFSKHSILVKRSCCLLFSICKFPFQPGALVYDVADQNLPVSSIVGNGYSDFLHWNLTYLRLLWWCRGGGKTLEVYTVKTKKEGEKVLSCFPW